MRRIGRGGSPEFVVGSCDYSSPCSSAETNFRELDDVFLQTQTKIWLGEVLHVRFDEETSTADLLADGELLFQVSKVVWKMLLKKHAELKYSKMNIHERTSSCKSGGRYMPYPKVDSFLRICQILGLTGVDLFSPSDVVEKRDTRRVCMSVRSLSKRARMKDLHVPDFDIVTYTIAMPTYMVGCIRRRLEQSCWSSTSSNSCMPCVDLKEIYRQRSLDSDYMWNHSSWSESDDAEETYREYELQSPASITSYYDADISSLIGENLSGSGPVTGENICPSQNFFPLDTREQDEDVFSSVQSVHTCPDTSMPFPHLNTFNGNFQLTITHCSESLPSCRMCQAHLDSRTSFSCMEDIRWLQTNSDSCTHNHKFDFGHSPVRNLACESNSCSEGNLKEENYEANSSQMRQNNSFAKFLPESYTNLEAVKDEFIKANVAPASKQLLTSSTEDCDTIEPTCMLLLDKITETNGRHVLKCTDGLSEHSSSGLLYSFCENRHPELHLMDTAGNALWDSNNTLDLNAGSWVNKNLMFRSPDTQSDNLDSVHPSTEHDYSVSIETVAHDQSGLHIEALNAIPRHLKDRTVWEVGDAEVSLTVSQNSVNAATAVCEDMSDTTNDCTGGSIQFPDLHTKIENEIDTMEGLPDSVDEGTSISILNKAPLNGNIMDPMSGKLYEQSVEPADLNRDSAVWHESQVSTIDSDLQILENQNQGLLDSISIGMSPVGSVYEKLCFSQVSVQSSKSNSNCIPRNEHCSQFIDIMQDASDSCIDCGKHLNRLISHNDNAFSDPEEQTIDSCAQLHNPSLSSDSFSTIDASSVKEDLEFNKLADDNGENCSSPFEDMKQILVNSFSTKNLVSESRAGCLSRASASFDDQETKAHHIVAVDGKSCTRSMNNQMVDNKWTVGFMKQATVALHTVTEREQKSLLVELRETRSPCCRMYNEPVGINQDPSGEPCTVSSLVYSIKDEEQKSSDHTNISEVPKEKILTRNESVSGSLCSDESLVSILHLDVNPRGNEASEGLGQENTRKMDSDASCATCLPLMELSERQASVDTWLDHLDHTEACVLKTGDTEISVGYNGDFFHTGCFGTNPETCTQVGSSDFDATDYCHGDSIVSCPEFRSSCVQSEGNISCSTACVLDVKNSSLQSIEVNNHDKPLMEEGANMLYCNHHGCIESIKKDAEDGDVNSRTSVRADEKKSERAAVSASKPAKKMLLKSFAGGVTLVGALFLLLRFRGRRERGKIVRNVGKFQAEKPSHERHPEKGRHSTLYPAENFKF